jgi:hypothetical protein
MNHTTAPSLPPLEGGCLCGRVRYRATPDHREGYYCHCRMCQLAFGNTRAAFMFLRKAQVQWTGEPPSYYASSKIARRGFCGHCGTPLSFEFIEGENMDLSVGSLDEPGALTPTEHFAVESRVAAWHAADGLKESQLADNTGIVRRWREAYGEGVTPGLTAARSGSPAIPTK